MWVSVEIRQSKIRLGAKYSRDKNAALKGVEANQETVSRFCNGNAPENVNAIFGSKAYLGPEKTLLREFRLQNVKTSNLLFYA